MTGTVPVSRTNNQDVDGLLTGTEWNTANLTYSFPTSASLYGVNYGRGEPQNHFAALNADQIAAVRSIMKMISSVTDLTFTEIKETATTHATLRFALSDEPASAWTYLPTDRQEGGDTWYGNSTGWYDSPVRGNYAFDIIIHELGHALGLKHGNESRTFGAMTAAHDSMEYSVMTYKSYVGADGVYLENEANGYAQTPMMYDIAALQHMYGADFSSNSGNTTYRWDPATGQFFVNGSGQGIAGDNRIFMTVWDGGGVDTYDFSNYTTRLTVDLRPGAWSKTSDEQIAQLGLGEYARGNIANALLYHEDARSLIENARGGTGADVITGNAAANVLRGEGGNDRMNGLAGRDTMIGGPGSDMLIGGSGRDIFMFGDKPDKTTNMDRIIDFNATDDTIDLDDAVFSQAGKTGTMSAAAFWNGRQAHDTSDRIIYDGTTGALLYDTDGSGKAAAVQFAKLPYNLKLTSNDFMIV